jgi:methyl-accepting chemotaxis protein
MSILEKLVPNFIRRSFLVKVMLGLVVVMMLTGAVGVFFYQGINSDLNSQVDKQVEATTVQHEITYDNWFDNRQDNLRGVLDNLINSQETVTEYRGLPAANFSNHLQAPATKTLTAQIQNYHYVHLRSGEIIASSEPSFEGLDATETFGVSESLLSQETFILPGTYLDADNNDVTAVGIGDPRRTGYVLLGEINLEEAGPVLAQGIEGANTGIVSGSHDHVIGHNPEIEDPPSNLDGMQVEDGGAIYAYRQVEDHSTENAEFYVVTQTPKSSAFKIADAVLQNFSFTLLFAFVILVGVIGTGGWFAVRNLNTLANRAQQMGEGDLDVDLETDRIDEIGVLYDEFDDMRNDLKERIQEAEGARDEAESARKEAEVARAEAEEMATYLQEKTEEYSEIMQEVGMGDLTQRMNKDGEEESMDRIAEEFNDMIEELEKTTGQLKSYVNEVEEAGAEVEQSADTVREASEQVADSIQKISDDAYNQKERLQGISEMMDQVTDDLEDIAADHDVDIEEPVGRIREIASDISEVVELSEETMAESQHVAGAAEEQAAELNEVSERANDLQRYAQPLRDILERFETEAEHEFVFSVGPTGGAESPGSRDGGDE